MGILTGCDTGGGRKEGRGWGGGGSERSGRRGGEIGKGEKEEEVGGGSV